MNQLSKRDHPYALQAGEGWIYRFGVDFILKASEIQLGSSVALWNIQQKRERNHLVTSTRPKMRCSMFLKEILPFDAVQKLFTWNREDLFCFRTV